LAPHIEAPSDQPQTGRGGATQRHRRAGLEFHGLIAETGRFFLLLPFYFRIAGPHEFPIEGVGVIFAVEKPEISQMPN
jgi:hypothetical protein